MTDHQPPPVFPHVTNELVAFELGVAARMYLRLHRHCPFPEGHQYARWWHEGYMLALTTERETQESFP